ncbi:MAG TPA: zf-HC2 domain-containing protein, partial [Vicinamibacteria bacterium]|nr:zf-HC2 domain-containing protein [Vicinamibacteria bacterium]
MSSHPAERLSAFLDGELSTADRAQVESHLRECPACAHELEELAAVDAFAREVPVPAPDGYFEELPARVRARVRRPARIPRPALWAVAAAAAVMAVVVTPVVLQHERSVVAPPAPAAQAVPQGPAPASLAASIAPAPRSFAQPADAGGVARPLSPAKS